MISPKDVHSLSDFQRNAKKMLAQLKKSKRPALLTVNGKGAVVVQDAAAYESLVSQLRLAADIAAVSEAISYGGEPRPVHEVFDKHDRELKRSRARDRRKSPKRPLDASLREGFADIEAGRLNPLEEAAARWKKLAASLDRRGGKARNRARKK